ncbi:hypothetical protein HK102_012324, partial [Quaeritorhiza haematococci]
MKMNKTSLPGRLLAAAVLAIGFGTAWFAFAMWLGSAVLSATRDEAATRIDQFVVTTDGTPLIMSMVADGRSRPTFRDLDGVARQDGDESRMVSNAQLPGLADDSRGISSPSDWRTRLVTLRTGGDPAEAWYFVHDGQSRGSGYFVGYERLGNRLLGSIDSSGFREGPVPPEDRIPFRVDRSFGPWSLTEHLIVRDEPGDLRSNLMLHVPSGNLIRLVDLSARTIATVFEAPEPIVSVSTTMLRSDVEIPVRKRRLLLVRTERAIYKLDYEYKLLDTIALPDGIDRGDLISWYESESGEAVVTARPVATYRRFPDGVVRFKLYRFGPGGAVQGPTEVAFA